MSDVDKFLMGGAPSAKFESIGAKVSGVITDEPTISQQTDFDSGELLFWNDGSPRNQMVVTLDTDERKDADDDGSRRLYVKSNLQKAVTSAVKAVGAPGLRVGGHLTVTYTSNGQKVGRGQPPKLYTAVYVPPESDEDNDKPPF